MEIWSGLSRTALSSSEGKSGKLRKSDHIADLFNHQPDEEKEKRATRVHLSNASRVLTIQHQEKVGAFLKANPEVANGLSEISLPGNEEARPSKGLVMRKMTAYLQWLDIRENHDGAPLADSDSEVPYLAIHGAEKDAELRNLVKERETAQKSIRDQRQKNVPNYYYLVYPETYSFN